MNEITRIHLAATPYNIEVSAKKDLEKYLAAIVHVLAADEDAQREIEARMVELLMERGVTDDKVVTIADVKALQAALGQPKDFAAVGTPPVPDGIKKRLMRDSEAGMLGGVLAGMAAYTGVDVVWWRIGAILLALASFGTVSLLYIVLWVVVPRAHTATERLQMRGVEPTLENIQRESARDVAHVPTQQKFLVVVLRILGVVSFLGAALTACLVMGVGVMYVTSTWAMDAWLFNAWLVGAAVSGVVSGVLFVALMLLGVYALATWKLTRKMSVTALVVMVAGLVAAGSAVVTMTYGVSMTQKTIDSHTVHRRIELAQQFKGATQLSVQGFGPQVSYIVTDGEPYAEVQSVDRPGMQKVTLAVDRQGDTVSVHMDHMKDRASCGSWGCARDGYTAVTIHGPVFERIRIDDANLGYQNSEQDILAIDANNAAKFSVDGKVHELRARVGENSSIVASNASVDLVQLDLSRDSGAAELGVVQQLMLTVPKSCSASSQRTVDYLRADTVMLNGVTIAGTEDTPCVTLQHEQADER